MFRRNVRRPKNLCLQGMTMLMMIVIIMIIIIIIIIITIIMFVFESLTSEIPFPSSCEEASISVSIPLKTERGGKLRGKYFQARSARRQHRAREKVRGAIIVSAPFPYRSAPASRPPPPPQFPPRPFRFAPATRVN